MSAISLPDVWFHGLVSQADETPFAIKELVDENTIQTKLAFAARDDTPEVDRFLLWKTIVEKQDKLPVEVVSQSFATLPKYDQCSWAENFFQYIYLRNASFAHIFSGHVHVAALLKLLDFQLTAILKARYESEKVKAASEYLGLVKYGTSHYPDGDFIQAFMNENKLTQLQEVLSGAIYTETQMALRKVVVTVLVHQADKSAIVWGDFGLSEQLAVVSQWFLGAQTEEEKVFYRDMLVNIFESETVLQFPREVQSYDFSSDLHLVLHSDEKIAQSAVSWLLSTSASADMIPSGLRNQLRILVERMRADSIGPLLTVENFAVADVEQIQSWLADCTIPTWGKDTPAALFAVLVERVDVEAQFLFDLACNTFSDLTPWVLKRVWDKQFTWRVVVADPELLKMFSSFQFDDVVGFFPSQPPQDYDVVKVVDRFWDCFGHLPPHPDLPMWLVSKSKHGVANASYHVGMKTIFNQVSNLVANNHTALQMLNSLQETNALDKFTFSGLMLTLQDLQG